MQGKQVIVAVPRQDSMSAASAVQIILWVANTGIPYTIAEQVG